MPDETNTSKIQLSVTKKHFDRVRQVFTLARDTIAELEGQAAHEKLFQAFSGLRQSIAPAIAALEEIEREVLGAIVDSKGGVKSALVALMLPLILLLGLGQPVYSQTEARQVNNATASAVGPAGVLANTSGLTFSISPGPVYCFGGLNYIHNTTFTLPANTGPYFVYFRCPSDTLNVALQYNPIPSIDIIIGTVTCGATTCATFVDLRSTQFFPNMSDLIIPFGPGDCAWNATGTLGATTALNLQAIGASFTMVNDISTTAAGATVDTLTCNIHVPQRTTASKGVQLLDCVIYYGVQTTALTSLGAPTLSTITMPAPGAGETPSTVTPVSLGAVTVTPVVGSANLSLTTAGAFVSEKVALNTAVFLNTDLQTIVFSQAFNQSAAAAQIVNTPGGVCHAVTVPL